MEENINEEFEMEMGIVKISDDVVGVIAALAATEVAGIVGMSGGLVGEITEILTTKKSLSKGVKVNVGESSATIDLFMVVEYGIKIPEVAMQVQENVKKAVESMTGLTVSDINIHVQGISLPKQEVVSEE